MWKTQDYDQGIFQILKFTENPPAFETCHLRNWSPGSKQSYLPLLPPKIRKSQCLLKTSEAPYAGRGLIINEQKKHQAELKTMRLAPICKSRHYSWNLKDFFICISIFFVVFLKGCHPGIHQEQRKAPCLTKAFLLVFSFLQCALLKSEL